MLSVEIRDRVALVRMEHGKVNALDIEFCRGVTARFRELAESAEAAVVLTGRGTVFSAGIDLLRVLDGGPEYIRPFLGAFHEFCETVFGFPKPLVAAVNGHAIAGGCVLACMGDHRLMAHGAARIGIPELRVGVPFPAAPLEVLRFALPARHFQQLLYGGATVDPEAAVRQGLIDATVGPGDLVDRAVDVARSLAAHGAEGFRLTKLQIRAHALERMARGHMAIGAAVERLWCDPATLAAVRDYVSTTIRPS